MKLLDTITVVGKTYFPNFSEKFKELGFRNKRVNTNPYGDELIGMQFSIFGMTTHERMDRDLYAIRDVNGVELLIDRDSIAELNNLERKHLHFDNILLPLGFEKTGIDLCYSHKMLGGVTFDLSATDKDIYWVMHRIFLTCVQHGKEKKTEEIKEILGI